MKKRISILMGCLLCTSAFAHDVFVAKREDKTSVLRFSSIIQPLKTTHIVSPVEGVVISRKFEYGAKVEKDQILIEVNSDKLESNFQQALTSYLTKKDSYFTAESKFKGTEQLWDLGILSRDEYKLAKSQLSSANISYIQALFQLEEIMKKGEEVSEDLTSLEITDMERVKEALKIPYNYLKVTAPSDGVALMPIRTQDSSGRVEVGTNLKMGEVITTIGDLSGFSLDIQVTEIDINRVKVGQKVMVEGVAFPGETLPGEVSRVDAQASTDGGRGGLPSFNVKLTVPNVSDEQREIIKVGMSAKIRLAIERKGVMDIPIEAVYQQGGKKWVNILENDKPKAVMVETSSTSLRTVEITKGIEVGTKILLPNHAA